MSREGGQLMAAKRRGSRGVKKLKNADLAKATSAMLEELAKASSKVSLEGARANAGRQFLDEITRLTGGLLMRGCQSQGCPELVILK